MDRLHAFHAFDTVAAELTELVAERTRRLATEPPPLPVAVQGGGKGARDTRESERPPAELAPDTTTILIVEEDPAVAREILSILAELCDEVIIAPNAQAGFSFARAPEQVISLVVMVEASPVDGPVSGSAFGVVPPGVKSVILPVSFRRDPLDRPSTASPERMLSLVERTLRG